MVAPAGGQTSTEVSSNPSVNQYVESVPTAKGPKPSRKAPGDRKGELSRDVRRQLDRQGAADAEALEAIATDPRLGAPPARPRGEAAAGALSPPPAAADKGFVPAITEAALDSDGGGTLLLIVLLTTIAAAVAGAAAARHRSRSG